VLHEIDQAVLNPQIRAQTGEISEVQQLVRQDDCSALALADLEFVVGSAFLSSRNPIAAVPYMRAAGNFAEQIEPAGFRWPLEFEYKATLVYALVESGLFEQARAFISYLRDLASAHHVDTLSMVSLFENAKADALAASQDEPAAIYDTAIDSLATGEARDSHEMMKTTQQAQMYLFLGEYGRGLDEAVQAHRLLERQEEAKRTSLALTVLRIRATAHLYLGDVDKALVVLQEGASLVPEILKQTPDRQSTMIANQATAQLYGKMAIVYLMLNRTEDAAAAVDNAKSAAHESRFDGLAEFLGLDRIKAQIEFNRAGAPRHRIDRARQALFQSDDLTGRLLLDSFKGFSPAQVSRFLTEFPQLTTLASREDCIQLYDRLGRAFEQSGDFDSAIANYLAAVKLIEGARAQAKDADALPLFFASYSDIYGHLIASLYDRSQLAKGAPLPAYLAGFGRTYPEVALYFAEAVHARRFNEQYASVLLDGVGARANVPEALIQQERQLRLRLGESPDSFQPANNPLAARKKSDEAAQAYVDFGETIRAKYSAFAMLVAPRPISVSQLPASLDGRFIVVYAATENNFYWWLVLNRTIVAFKRNDVSRAQLRRVVSQFPRLMDDSDTAKSLAQWLVAGPFTKIESMVQKRNETHPHVVIIPDDATYTVPWEALPESGGNYLGEKFVISYIPSLTSLAQSSAAPVTSARERLLAIGNAQSEAVTLPIRGKNTEFSVLGGADLSKLTSSLRTSGYHVEIAEGPAATGFRLLATDLSSYSFVHFDSHAFAGTVDPPPSLILHRAADSPLGLLTLGQIPKLRLQASLVTLSACETALGAESNGLPGEGIESLARAFMLAGSRSVVASLWPVRTSAAEELIENLYKGIVGPGPSDRALALYNAKATLRAKGYPVSQWAAFILIGNPNDQ
jgi:CHAT domain-containing protein